MDIETAIKAYTLDRQAQVSARMVAYWDEQSRPLAVFFKKLKLKTISPAHIASYQNARIEAGRAPKTINGEVALSLIP